MRVALKDISKDVHLSVCHGKRREAAVEAIVLVSSISAAESYRIIKKHCLVEDRFDLVAGKASDRVFTGEAGDPKSSHR